MRVSKVRPRRTKQVNPTRKSEDKQARQDRLDKWARSDAKGNVGEYTT